jgi:hypothetical protein
VVLGIRKGWKALPLMSSCGGSGSFFDYYSGYDITNKDIFKLKK